MLFRVAPDIDAFIKLSSNAPSRTPFDAPNSILTALIVLGKGTGNNTNILNATTTSVNNFIRKLYMKDPTVEYIDTISDFFNQRAIVKSLSFFYDQYLSNQIRHLVP
jgi:hypothetical protein